MLVGLVLLFSLIDIFALEFLAVLDSLFPPGIGAQSIILIFGIVVVCIFRHPTPLVSLGALVVLVALSSLVAPGGEVVPGSLFICSV